MKWEFTEKVKSKAFLISLVLMPVIIVAFGVLPALLVGKPDSEPISIGVYDKTGLIADSLSTRLDAKYKLPNGVPNYLIRKIGKEKNIIDAKSEAMGLIASGRIEGYYHIPASALDSGKLEYRGKNVGNIKLQERLNRTIEEVITEYRLSKAGFNPSFIRKLSIDVDVKSIKINEKGEENEAGFMETFYTSYILVMMLMFLVMTAGQLLIRSFVEEKSNRVIEVLLSSTSPMDLMIGKVLGLSALGLFQVGIWLLIGMAIALKTGSKFFLADNLMLSLVYFVLGHLFYTSIFIGAGSPVNTEQEAQQLTSYISLAMVFPIVLAFPAMQNPDSLLLKVLSFIPIFTPTFMLLRLPIQMPAWWEIAGTIALLIVSNIVTLWVASKIFRIAILSYGKRPGLKVLLRWLKQT